MNKTLSLILLPIILVFSLAGAANAGVRDAIDALQVQNFDLVLAEVKDAVDKKEDDGLILFLSLLQISPQTWQAGFNPKKQEELFSLLEKLTSQSSLQSQYRLAILPRKPNLLPFTTHKAQLNDAELIRGLEKVAEKGYAYAALHLYGIYAHGSEINSAQATAIKWLKKAAEQGNAEAAFLLGMKYLNIEDDLYGCYSYRPSRCLPKDVAKGWYWMQQAAMRATKRNILLGDFAYQMGNLYLQGINGTKPDTAEAYAWYLVSMENVGYAVRNEMPKLKEMHKTGQLKKLDPALDEVWEDAKSGAVLLSEGRPFRKPSLFKPQQFTADVPIFSFMSISWFKTSQVLDVYPDGRVHLLLSNQWGDMGENEELWFVIQREKIDEFLEKLKGIGFEGWQSTTSRPLCEADCSDGLNVLAALNTNQMERTIALNTRILKEGLKPVDPHVSQLLALMEEYFPVRELLCSVDTGESKQQCLQITRNILKVGNEKEK